MATLGYAYADAAATPATTTISGGKARGRGGNRLLGGTRNCWMLFEYCNKGVLAVS
jgi:hypothetical protein